MNRFMFPRRHSTALLSAGNINLTNGESTHFNVIDNQGDGKGALFLARIEHNGSFQVFSGAGSPDGYKEFQPGMRPVAHHDQSGRERPVMTIIATGTTTQATLDSFRSKIATIGKNKKSVAFAVFK